ncbi:hypothetical protein Nepgr_014131 [Nepenthes gracilis]|uniref:Dof zinc finger protein n=1 Tax=Nepenthes gracilis TaxID=150966 RepID=A0AAD3SIL9_NEPGR|nr:hypothetical protein Nepgr_014131 [Nepenthes gracilis]
MVFSSLPLYLDPPNWQQQQGGGNHENLNRQPPVPPPNVGGVGGGATTFRPNSTAERARLAQIPKPETPLRCPRCESTKTKFCYFNNYSLSQPRHFCKTCRRYWTRDGALRNVPVGGGCRKSTKRSKTGRLKSPAASTSTALGQQRGPVAASGAVGSNTELIGGHFLQPTPQLSFMDSLQNLTQSVVGNMGLNFEAIQPHVAGFSGEAPQLPFFGDGFEAFYATDLNSHPFQNGSVNGSPPKSYGAGNDQNYLQIDRTEVSITGEISQLAPVKMVNNNQGLSISKHQVGMPENNQFCNSAGDATVWKDLSGPNTFFY